MGRIDRDTEGNLAVVVDTEADAAQLRATIKASDGADEIAVQAGQTAVFNIDNPFNFFALWATDFLWAPDALRAAVDCLVPIAQASMHLNTKSHRKLMRRMTQEMSRERGRDSAP